MRRHFAGISMNEHGAEKRAVDTRSGVSWLREESVARIAYRPDSLREADAVGQDDAEAVRERTTAMSKIVDSDCLLMVAMAEATNRASMPVARA